MTTGVTHARGVLTWRLAVIRLVVGLSLLPLIGRNATPGQAAATLSAYDLIAAVNQLREANNLPAYQINPALMAAAQAHSEYQASIGQVTHTGAGGTRARDRASAAGYGGGATVFVSENIAGGSSLTVQGAVQMWLGDSLHLNTLLSANYTDIGAGIAKANGSTYYTLDAGYVAGTPGNGETEGGKAVTPSSSKPTATTLAFFPIEIATPGPDGSVIHLVKSGQTLWSIAALYKIDMDELLRLNHLARGAFIYPGDELLIKAAENLPAATELAELATDVEHENTVTPTVTRRPRSTITPAGIETETLVTTLQITPEVDYPQPALSLAAVTKNAPLLIIAILILGGTALFLLGNLLNHSG